MWNTTIRQRNFYSRKEDKEMISFSCETLRESFKKGQIIKYVNKERNNEKKTHCRKI